jgi:CRP-like cAMP-binding protein
MPAQERAAHQLITPDALVQLSLADAREVVRYMQPQRVDAGTAIFQAGESADVDYMLLVIDGDVTVESQASATTEGMVVTVLGAGSLIGEMGLIDGEPRSATCIAATDLSVGKLSRTALAKLIKDKPAVGARLLLAISKRLSDHLREANRKLMTFTQVSRALQQELDAVHAVNRRLLAPKYGADD